MHNIALRVAKHLHLDMARPLEIALEEDSVISERARRLALRADKGARKFVGARHNTHAAAAAAGRGFDQHGIPDALGFGRERCGILRLAVITGHHGHAMPFHQRLCRGFRAHRADRLGRRSDEDKAGFRAGLGKIRILGQKAIAGMDRLGAARTRRLDDRRDIQITLARRRRTDPPCLVRHRDMQCVCIGVGIDRDRRDAHSPRRAADAAGDLAAIGDQDFSEHGPITSGRRQSGRRHATCRSAR